MKKHPDADCENCPLNSSVHSYVPSSGPEKADLVIVGEAPGFNEAKKGQPFVGASGQLLDAVLDEYGIDREKAFLTNTVLCRPKGNATPSKKAISACGQRLHKEIRSREPRTILTLGATAGGAIAGTPIKITKFRAGPPKVTDLYPGVKFVATIHPAACLYQPDNFPYLDTDIGKVTRNTKILERKETIWRAFTEPENAIKALQQIMDNYDDLVLDIETAFEKDAEFVQANHYPLLCVGIGYAPNKVAVFGLPAIQHPDFKLLLSELLRTKKVTCHNGKFDFSGLADINPDAVLTDDTMLMHYCLDERKGTHKLEILSVELLGADHYKSMTKKGFPWLAEHAPRTLFHYNALDCANTWDVRSIVRPQVQADPNLKKLYSFLMEASDMLMHVEREGTKIDVDLMEELAKEWEAKLEFIEHKFKLFFLEKMPTFIITDSKGKGVEFNPRSYKHIQKVLAGLGVTSTGEGTYEASTDADHIQAILENNKYKKAHAFCARLLEYRTEQKLYATYIDGIRKKLFQGRIHTTFLIHGSNTGRLTSRGPNLQNIPRGPNIKRMFVPSKGYALIQADYSQIEYRTVACLSVEEVLREIFIDPKRDVFGEFANEIFNSNWSMAEFKQYGTEAAIYRQIVKRIIHGTNYGMRAKTLTEQVNGDARKLADQTGNNDFLDFQFTVTQGKRFQDRYKQLVPNLMKWQKDTIKEVHEKQELLTPFGRYRRFPLITDVNKYDIEKEGLAFKPQSISSDICLRGGMLLRKRLPKDAGIRLFVHDSIMAECRIPDVEQTSAIMAECMTESARMFSNYVPFALDIKASEESWAKV